MQSCIQNQERHHAAIDLGVILSPMVSYINEFSRNHIFEDESYIFYWVAKTMLKIRSEPRTGNHNLNCDINYTADSSSVTHHLGICKVMKINLGSSPRVAKYVPTSRWCQSYKKSIILPKPLEILLPKPLKNWTADRHKKMIRKISAPILECFIENTLWMSLTWDVLTFGYS